jgi:hypothetical protein
MQTCRHHQESPSRGNPALSWLSRTSTPHNYHVRIMPEVAGRRKSAVLGPGDHHEMSPETRSASWSCGPGLTIRSACCRASDHRIGVEPQLGPRRLAFGRPRFDAGQFMGEALGVSPAGVPSLESASGFSSRRCESGPLIRRKGSSYRQIPVPRAGAGCAGRRNSKTFFQQAPGAWDGKLPLGRISTSACSPDRQ